MLSLCLLCHMARYFLICKKIVYKFSKKQLLNKYIIKYKYAHDWTGYPALRNLDVKISTPALDPHYIQELTCKFTPTTRWRQVSKRQALKSGCGVELEIYTSTPGVRGRRVNFQVKISQGKNFCSSRNNNRNTMGCYIPLPKILAHNVIQRQILVTV